MYTLIDSGKGYLFALENSSIRADMKGHIYGGGCGDTITEFFEDTVDWAGETFQDLIDVPKDIVTGNWSDLGGDVVGGLPAAGIVAAPFLLPMLFGGGAAAAGGAAGAGATGLGVESALGLGGSGMSAIESALASWLPGGAMAGTGLTGTGAGIGSALASWLPGGTAALEGIFTGLSPFATELLDFSDYGDVFGSLSGGGGGGGGGGGIWDTVKNIGQSIFGGGTNQQQGTQQGTQQQGGNLLNTLFGGGGSSGGNSTGIDWLDKLLGIGLPLASSGLEGWLTGEEMEKQRKFYEDLYAPMKEYQQEQLNLFKDVWEPNYKQMFQTISEDFTEPLSMTEKRDYMDLFKPIEQKTSERLAGTGMLNQPVAENLWTTMDVEKGKGLEDLLFKKRQTAKQNMISLLGNQPTYQTPQAVVPTTQDWSGISDLGFKLGDLFNQKDDSANLLKAMFGMRG